MRGGVEERVIGREKKVREEEEKEELGLRETERDKETERWESGWDGRVSWGGMEMWRRGCRGIIMEIL